MVAGSDRGRLGSIATPRSVLLSGKRVPHPHPAAATVSSQLVRGVDVYAATANLPIARTRWAGPPKVPWQSAPPTRARRRPP